jgi:hypothetical protein
MLSLRSIQITILLCSRLDIYRHALVFPRPVHLARHLTRLHEHLPVIVITTKNVLMRSLFPTSPGAPLLVHLVSRLWLTTPPTCDLKALSVLHTIQTLLIVQFEAGTVWNILVYE